MSSVHVGTLTASVIDEGDLVGSRLPLLAAVVGLSFLFLLAASARRRSDSRRAR